MVSQVESCATDAAGSYAGCLALADTGITPPPAVITLPAGSVGAAATGYRVTATSDSGGTFSIAKDPASGESTRACSAAGVGGCRTGGLW